jgi:hypothetical protein
MTTRAAGNFVDLAEQRLEDGHAPLAEEAWLRALVGRRGTPQAQAPPVGPVRRSQPGSPA